MDIGRTLTCTKALLMGVFVFATDVTFWDIFTVFLDRDLFICGVRDTAPLLALCDQAYA